MTARGTGVGLSLLPSARAQPRLLLLLLLQRELLSYKSASPAERARAQSCAVR